MELFQQHYLFNHLSLHQIATIISKSKLITCVKDSIIFRENSSMDGRSSTTSKKKDSDQKFYFVKQGIFKLLKKTENKFFSQQISPEDSCRHSRSFGIEDLSALLIADTYQKQSEGEKYSVPRQVEVTLIMAGTVVGLAEIINKETKRKYSLISCDNDCQIYEISLNALGGRAQFFEMMELGKGNYNYLMELQQFRKDRQEQIQKVINSVQEKTKRQKFYYILQSLQNSIQLKKGEQLSNRSEQQESSILNLNNSQFEFQAQTPNKLNLQLQLQLHDEELNQNSVVMNSKRDYFSSRKKDYQNTTHYNSFVKSKNIQQNFKPHIQYDTGILEDIVSHDAIYLKQYRLKIDQTVKNTLQHLKKNHHYDNNINELVQFKIQQTNDEINQKRIYHNRLRQNSCADKAYQVFEQYKDNMVKFQKKIEKKWNGQENLGIDTGVTQRILLTPSTAVRNVKRKIKQSRRDIFKTKNQSFQLDTTKNEFYK